MRYILNQVCHNGAKFLYSANRMVFHEFRLDTLQEPTSGIGDDIFCEEFDEHDIDLLDAAIKQMDFPSEVSREGVLERLAGDYDLFVARNQNEIIGYLWIVYKHYKIPYFPCTLSLKPNEFFTINAYTRRDFRGRDIFSKLKHYAFSTLRGRKFERALGSYFSWNKASERANQKFGSHVIGHVTYGYVLTVRYWYSTVQDLELRFHESPFLFWKIVSKHIRRDRNCYIQ